MSHAESGFTYQNAAHSHAHDYLLPRLQEILARYYKAPSKLFEVGCGNGSIGHALHQSGWTVQGIDASASGVELAKQHYPELDLRVASAYDPLRETFGRFPLVLSLEVVEHLYEPRRYAQTIYDMVEDDGLAVISTPYHGYWKNLALAVSDKLDQHFTALWDGGHIKFWSVSTLSTLLEEAGFEVISVDRVGRFAPLAKSMILVARKRVG